MNSAGVHNLVETLLEEDTIFLIAILAVVAIIAMPLVAMLGTGGGAEQLCNERRARHEARTNAAAATAPAPA